MLPERTFREKVTILHKEAFRANGKFPARYSRHYYDLYCMDVLREDYAHMQGMLFGTIPAFEDIMQCIRKLEAEINSLGQI